MVVDVDKVVGLVDFVASDYFHFDPFLELWRAYSDFIVKEF